MHRTVTTAKTAGFCFGVKRAVEMAYSMTGKSHVFTYGPIIHNEAVVEDLEKKGIAVLHSLSEAEKSEPGTVIIRSHGAARAEIEKLSRLGYEIVDATCPFVKKIHRIVSERSALGEQIVIFGDPDHPEVKAISGWCAGRPIILNTEDDVQSFTYDRKQKLCIVAQTTFNYKKFQLFVDILQKKE